MKVKWKLCNRLHDVCVGMSSLVILLLVGNFLIGQVSEAIGRIISPRSVQIVHYQVETGDTLWQLASRTAMPEEDVRDKVIEIRRINGMSATAPLVPGQIVKISVQDVKDSGLRYTFKTEASQGLHDR